MTEPNTETDHLPHVVLSRSWTVHTFFKDDDGDYGVDDEEFIDQAEALRYAAQQADKHQVCITYGHVA